MKRVGLTLLSILNMLIPLASKGNLPMAANAAESGKGSPLIEKINHDSDDLHIFFIEHGLRDSNGVVPSDSNGVHTRTVVFNGVESNNNVYKNCADCAIIIYKDFQMIIDCGLGLNHSFSRNATSQYITNGAKQVIQIMENCLDNDDNVWDAMVFTHEDSDHIFGGPSILKYTMGTAGFSSPKFTVETVYDFAYPDRSYYGGKSATGIFKSYVDTMANAYQNKRINHQPVSNYFYSSNDGKSEKTINSNTGVVKYDDNFSIKFFKNPYQVGRSDKTNINDTSVILCLEYKKQKFLFTGDLETRGIDALINQYKDYFADGVTFYKAGHHGSVNANPSEFIDLIRPQYIFVPAVAGTAQYHHDEDQVERRFPNSQIVDYFFKYTDYIYLASEAINGEDATTKKWNITNYKSLYGDLLFVFNGGDSTKVYSTNLSNSGKEVDTPIYSTKWFCEERNPFISMYTFQDNGQNATISNCSLIKFGHYDILIDCGSLNGQSSDLIDDVTKYVVDKKIEYLVCTSATKEHLAQLVGSYKDNVFAGDGILSLFNVEVLIDFGLDTGVYENQIEVPYFTEYRRLIKEKKITHHVLDHQNRKNNHLRYPITTLDGVDATGDAKKLILHVINPQEVGTNKTNTPEDDHSLCTVVTFLEQKFVLLSNLEDATYLINEEKELISNATLMRASQSRGPNSNPRTLLDIIKPENIVIGSPVNDKRYNFGTKAYTKRLYDTFYKFFSASNVYITEYLDSSYNKNPVNGDMVFTYNPNREDRKYECYSLLNQGIGVQLRRENFQTYFQ